MEFSLYGEERDKIVEGVANFKYLRKSMTKRMTIGQW